MKVLVLGGSVFLSQAVARDAAARGHEVVAVTRGLSGAVPDGVRHVVADRDDGFPRQVAAQRFDAVVDVSGTPSHVRRAVAATSEAHWVYVSTINVYADDADPGGPGVGRLRAPEPDDIAPTGPETYGAMKVACEQLVRDGARSSAVVRPGLIVGPHDDTGRFAYWPARMGRLLDGSGTAEVLAPGDPADVVQIVDVRDLAAWIGDLAVNRTEGVFDGVGSTTPIKDVLDAVARGCGAVPRWRWVGTEHLGELDVRPWAGERSVPLWLPRPQYDGMMAHDAEPARAAGLRCRPVEDSARDVLAWLAGEPEAAVTGLTAGEEAEVLRRTR